MRKVLSFVLVLSLVLGSFGMAFAAPLSDVAGEKCEDAVNVLTNLGVVSGYPNGKYKPDQVVTRAEMAVIIVRALGLADYATGTSSFSDMAGHWSNPYVAYATSLGIIDGYPDGTFRPDNTVSYDEAAKMLVAALGYTPESLTGTWPANYVVKARSLGILDGIKAGPAGANRGDIAIMAFQTLGAKIGSTDKDGKWTANEPDDTMLERLGAKVYVSDEDKEANKKETAFVLDEEWVDDALINIRHLLGAYVTAYVNDEDDIIAIKEVKSTFLIGTFEDSFDGDFETDDKDYEIRNVTSESAILYLYNGEVDEDDAVDVSSDPKATFKIAAKVSGNKIDEIYSVSLWKVNEAGLFEEDDLDDESLLGEEFKLDDNDEIDLNSFELVGVDSLDDIDEDNVVYVYVGPNSDKITRVAVGTEVVEGKVTKANSVTDPTTVTIAGKSYDVAKDSDTSISVGDTGTAYLDFEGKIFAWEQHEDRSAGNYALVIARAKGNDLDNDRVRLLLADGTKKTFEVGSKAYAASTTIAAFGKGDLVTYSVDKDGNIDRIIKVEDKDIDTAKKPLSKSGAILDGKQVASNVVVFEVEVDKEDNSTIPVGVVDLDDLDRDHTGYKYYIPSDKSKIEVIIADSDNVDSAKDTVFAVINKVEFAVDDDDDDVYYVTGFANGKAFNAYTDSRDDFDEYDAHASGAGIWEIELDDDGVIVEANFHDLNDIVATSGGIKDALYKEGMAVTARDGNLVEIDEEDWYAIDSSAFFYAFDSKKTNPYSLKKLSDVKGKKVVLVQVDDESEYYDLVLILLNVGGE